MSEPASAGDTAVVAAQLGRPPRGLRAVAHRCPCGLPDVIETSPRLADGSPFPTLYYLTCPRACSAVGRLEASGAMAEMTARLGEDADMRAAHARAYGDYVTRRDAIEMLPGAPGVGGMPDRVKCLHALVAHELAVPGSNPFGQEALAQLPRWWEAGRCVDASVAGTAGRPGDGAAGRAAGRTADGTADGKEGQ